MTIADATITEGNAGTATAVFAADVVGDRATQTVTVAYATTGNGTAVAPGDYATTSGTVTFDPGVTTQTVGSPSRATRSTNSTRPSPSRSAIPVNIVIARAVATGTIVNDDPQPSLSINDVSVTEGASGVTNAVFTVTLSQASGRTVSVASPPPPGPRSAGSDYVTTSGTLTFDPGAMTQHDHVPVLGDQLNEGRRAVPSSLERRGRRDDRRPARDRDDHQ